MAKLRILHLSDIHIGNTNYEESVDIAIPILEALEIHNKDIDCVIVTGDIFDGKPSKSTDRNKKALELFNYLKAELSLSAFDFVFVPGNHDLKRTADSANFDEYKSFLKDFYGEDYYIKNFSNEFLFNTKVFEENKVAIIGLNSCMLETCSLDKNDIEWLKEIEIDKPVKDEIVTVLENKKKNEWDDYGFISKKQLRDSFKHLEKELEDLSSYTIVACFHHHFYPFPEIYSQYGDSSIIRNFTDVIEKFQQKNVKIVLHGHKHLPIIRPVTNHKYLSNPDSIFYVFSAGSIAKKDIVNRSFQQIDVFSPNGNRLADICRFNFKQEELQAPETFRIPPKKIYEQNAFIEIINMFKEEFPDEYHQYKKEIYEYDNISQHFRIDDVINNISKTITQFETLRTALKSSVNNIQVLLYAIHYRINHLNNKAANDKSQKKFISKLKEYYSSIFQDKSYETLLWKLIESNRNISFEKIHDELFSKHIKFNDYTAHITIAIFFTDLYLTFIKYGEIYYNDEKIKHKVNIKLESDTFHESIPVSTIKITSNVDRRLATISFKCKNPTVHKIAVLIVKDFEKRISKIEDSFKHFGLKIYYLIPKVEQDNYDLEDLNFEAYIPSLLPLLTGENLYKRREVFSRELIQNSLDAILLRGNIIGKNNNHLTEQEKIIKIEIGSIVNPQTGKDRRYLKIDDNGIGMDSFKIERYFTSIGRSFYQSDEFEELQKSEEIQYKPVSNFGIGFLSAFMVSSEIEVTTRSYDNDYGMEIHIPNYDGCFFIRKTKGDESKIGTSITLYEDSRKYLNPDKIIKYIKDTFCDFQLLIEVNNKIKNKVTRIEPFQLRHKKDLILFCPIIDDNTEDISWAKEVKGRSFIDKYNYGVLLEFNDDKNKLRRNDRKSRHNQYLNSGILLSDSNKDLDFNETSFSRCYFNLPSSYINLDVAREKILSFKKKSITKKSITNILAKQGVELLEDINKSSAPIPIKSLNNISHFFKINGANQNIINSLDKNLYCMNFQQKGGNYVISLEKEIQNNSFIKFDFPLMIKIYYKILSQVTDVTPGLFNKKNVLEEYAEKLSLAYEQIFSQKKIKDFDNKFSQKFDIEFIHRFNEEFSYRFEKEFINMPSSFFNRLVNEKSRVKIDDELMHRFLEFTHMFDSNLFHQIDDEFISVFEDKSMHHVEREIMESVVEFEHISPNEIYHEYENKIRKISKERIHLNPKLYNSKNEYYNLISFLVFSHFINETRRGKRMHLRLSSLYGLFYLLYEFIITRLLVSDIKEFKIKI